MIKERLSGSSSKEQLLDETKLIPNEEKQSLMKELNFSVYVSEEQNLAMKADLGLPWRKIRIMKRYCYF